MLVLLFFVIEVTPGRTIAAWPVSIGFTHRCRVAVFPAPSNSMRMANIDDMVDLVMSRAFEPGQQRLSNMFKNDRL
jgi:hypothetical protein